MYSVKIKAWKYVNGKKIYIGNSRNYHVAGKENRTYTNAKKLKLAKEKYVLKKGKSARIKVTVISQSKKKGTCYVYVTTLNGVRAKIKITVK